jgi:Protein of unknown function (DUF3667)
MSNDTSSEPELDQPSPEIEGERVSPPAPERGRFTLASLLDISDDDLIEPLPRVAPHETRWEQLSLGVQPESGAAIPTELRSGTASQTPHSGNDLIPGLEVPGAVEVPVYLAGKALHELMHGRAADAVQDGDGLGNLLAADAAGWELPEAQETTATPSTNESVDATTVLKTPSSVPALVTPGNARRRRKKPDAPVANFARAEGGSVLWPKLRQPKTSSGVRDLCARCGGPFVGEACESCGYHTAVQSQASNRGIWGSLVGAFVDSDSRLLRTIGALVLAPGELTASFLAGDKKRFYSPAVIAVATLVVFAIVGGVGSLRPRPDRALVIGSDRTGEVGTGLTDAFGGGSVGDDVPTGPVHLVLATIAYAPVLWLPVMALFVLAAVAAARSFQRHDTNASIVFTAHFAAWFTLWWGLATPVLLLLTKFGFEFSAAQQGVTKVRYDIFRIEGLSQTWNAMRNVVVMPAFHSGLLALGIIPWVIVAYRNAFETSWLKAALVGLAVSLIPLLLLIPFA